MIAIEQDAIHFAITSATMAFDQAEAYGGLENSIASFRENIRDTLNDEGVSEFEKAAWAAYDLKIRQLKAKTSIMQTTFKELDIGDKFTMSGSSFDLGRVYRKLSARTYSEIDKTGGLKGSKYRVGSINVTVDRPSDN